MSRKRLIIPIAIAVLALASFVFLNFKPLNFLSPQGENVTTLDMPSAGEKKYSDPQGHFSFTLPSGYTVRSVEDGAGETLLVQKNDDPKQSFQIFISPFDEEGPITPKRIFEDLPDMTIKEPQEAIIGKDKLRALIFKSIESAFGGDTREVWFVQDGYLYQITAPIALDPELAEMMKTWGSIL